MYEQLVSDLYFISFYEFEIFERHFFLIKI